jgi:hypothetical protein
VLLSFEVISLHYATLFNRITQKNVGYCNTQRHLCAGRINVRLFPVRGSCVTILNAVNYQYCEIGDYDDSDCNVTVFWSVTSYRFIDGYKGFGKNPTTIIFGIEMLIVLILGLKLSLRQNSVKCSRAVSSVKVRKCSVVSETKSVAETSDNIDTLTRLSAREHFIVVLLLKAESAGALETSISMYKTIRYHISDDRKFNIRVRVYSFIGYVIPF